MPTGTISSSPDTVGVAVVNYEVPVVETKEQVLENCRKIAQYIEGTKRGYPGLDLIIFPEYSTQGFHPTKWKDLTTTVPGPETAIFSEACRKNKVWGVFSITGEQNPKGAPFNSFLIINEKGEIPPPEELTAHTEDQLRDVELLWQSLACCGMEIQIDDITADLSEPGTCSITFVDITVQVGIPPLPDDSS